MRAKKMSRQPELNGSRLLVSNLMDTSNVSEQE